MATLAAYRNVLRATRIAFQGDERVLSAARQQARAGFRAKANLQPSDPAVGAAIEEAQAVADILRANIVQGRRDGNGDLYSECWLHFFFSFPFFFGIGCVGVSIIIFLLIMFFDKELRIHEHTERGDNDSITLAGMKKAATESGSGCCSS